jgi:diguanylate cyclase (GGDEF)-like protein
MFKWKRTPTDEPPAAPGLRAAPHLAAPVALDPEAESALDAFVAVLRALGQHAFDLEHEGSITFSQQCEAWARHLAILGPPPTVEQPLDADGRPLPYDGPRDWPTVRQFIVNRRLREQQHVNKSLGDLRQGIWAFAQSLGTALIEDQRMDGKLKSQIDRLKVAVEHRSTEDLKNEMMSAANSLSALVSERQQTQRVRLEELGQRVTDLAGQLRDAKQQNVRDSLTQLANRRGFDEFMNRMVFMRDVFGEAAALLMVDVDHFKKVNDTHGHPGGDAVLKALSDCLVRNFPRKSDMVARYGGEELAVVLPDTSIQNAVRLAERTRNAVSEIRVEHGGQIISITISIGVAQLGRQESVQAWLERTDQALYQAKRQGRNRVMEASSPD